MTEITRTGEGHRLHVHSPLMRESLVSKELASKMAGKKVINIIPDCNVVFLGGHSIIDRGKHALFPLLDSLVEARKAHKIVVGVGGGARLRHVFDICLDLGLPTGGLAMVAGASIEQNSRMLWALLAKHNGMAMNKENMLELPHWLESGMIPVMASVPPYHFWEPPSGKVRIPYNGTDLGIYIFAEVMGARSMIFVKDEDGLYTNDPKVDKKAKFIPKIGVRELLEMDLPDLVVEKVVLETMLNAKSMRKIQIINGLKPELLPRALAGEEVGTIIDADL